MEHGLDSPKGNPPTKRSQNSPEFCYTFYDHRGWSTSRHPSVRLGGLSRAKTTRAKNSSSNSSTFSEVLSLLSFTTPLDSLRSRVAPFTFFNRYTFVTLHVTPRTYITSIARIYNALPPRKLHICVLLRIRTPTTTPLPNGRTHLTTTHHVHLHNTRQHVTHTYG